LGLPLYVVFELRLTQRMEWTFSSNQMIFRLKRVQFIVGAHLKKTKHQDAVGISVVSEL
jgi:hypothetical protein